MLFNGNLELGISMKFSVIVLVSYTVSFIVMVSDIKIAELKNRGKISKVLRNVEFELFRKLLFRDTEFWFGIRIEELIQILIAV